jgi:hypothetical protein
MIVALSTITLLANNIDKEVTNYETKRIKRAVQRGGGKLNSIKLVLKKDLKNDGWYGYVFSLDITIRDKNIVQNDSLFAKNNLIAPELLNIKTKRSFKDELFPILSQKYFKKEHLIAGDINAKHTIVLFSDPLCPICLDEVPDIIKAIIDNPKNIALYYYHMPLDMHPTAKTLSIASIIAKEQGIKDVDYKVYKANFPEKYHFDAYEERDQAKVLRFFNREFHTNITMNQINNKKYIKILDYDKKMSDDALVQGTPTIFIDGVYDRTRDKYKEYLK